MAYPATNYSGPGAPPVTFHFRSPGQFEIYIRSAPGFNVGLGFSLQGRFVGARRGTIWEPLQSVAPKGCGWPAKTLTWQLRPRKRRAAAASAEPIGQRRRTLGRLRRELRRIRARDYFPPPERELAQQAVDELAAVVEEPVG